MEHIYIYMSDGTCHTAMDTNGMNGAKCQFCLLFLELPNPTYAHPSHVTSPLTARQAPHSQAVIRYDENGAQAMHTEGLLKLGFDTY